MSALTHVFATVPEGREVPIPASEGSSSGGGALRCVPGKVYRLGWTTYTRRRVTGGDLVLTNQGGTKVADPEAARASASIKVDADGAVDADQRTDAEVNLEADKAKAAEEAAAKVGASPTLGSPAHDSSTSSPPRKFDTSDAKGKA